MYGYDGVHEVVRFVNNHNVVFEGNVKRFSSGFLE